jgi:class 3 adenylate cyclase/pimeloyl-ACP methyl ester carboxylesterase
MMEPQVRYVRTKDGVSIAFYTLGSGPPLVWMPDSGLPLSHLQAEWQLPYLRAGTERASRRWALVKYDPRGSGLSDRNASDKSLNAFVQDLEAVTDKLELSKFRLFATGTNTPIAITYVSRHPERVSHLVTWHGQARQIGSEAIRHITALAAKDWKLASETFALAFHGISEAEIARQYAECLRESVTPEHFGSLMDLMPTWDVTELLPSVTVPTLIVHYRDQAYLSIESARTLAAAIPNARLSLHEGSAPGIINPSASEAIRSFLREGEEAPALDPQTPSGTAIILFADIADSTALTERLGDAGFREKAREVGATLRKLIRECGGVPVEGPTLGDGLLATFASAREGIQAALAGGKAADDAGLPLHLGLHAGDISREKDPDGRDNVYGGAVNIAARISGLSAPGEVLVSQTVRDLARTSAGVRFEDRGEQGLKGVGEAVRVWAVLRGPQDEREEE